jgi:hypothetical protein
MDDFALYKTYVSLKNHFTTDSYDFVKYSGKVNVKEETYHKRSDRQLFHKLSSWLPERIAIPFLVSHFVELSSFSIHFVFENPIKSQKIFDRWKERTSDILGLYERDLRTIATESSHSWTNVINQKDDDYPLLFKLVMSNRISPETYSLLDDLFQHTSKVYKGLDMDVLFLSMNLKYRKYRSFIAPTIQDVLRVTPRDLTKI